MKISEKIEQDLKEAMKEGVATRTATLRLIKNSFNNEQIKLGHELSEEEITKVLQREAKQRRDSIEAYQKGGRDDLAASEQAELDVIQKYLPEAMSEEELSKLVDEVVDETGSSGAKDMGVVIGAVMKKAAGKAEGSEVARLVRQKLQ